TQARDPCGHLSACHEKFFAGPGRPSHVEPDKKHRSEVDSDDHHIDRGQMNQLCLQCSSSGGWPALRLRHDYDCDDLASIHVSLVLAICQGGTCRKFLV